MREENPIEVAISLLWNASIHFIFLSRMEGKIPLARSVSKHINYNLLNLTGNYLTESCKKSNGVSAEKIQRFVVWSN